METQLASEIRQTLNQYTGSQTMTRWSPLFRDVASEGVLAMAEITDGYWLLDAISSHLMGKKVPLGNANLKVSDNKACLELCCGDNIPFASQDIPYTDFPLDEIDIWFGMNEFESYTLYLPREH